MSAKLPPPGPTRNITPDEKRAMQTRLKFLGYYTDGVDGRWGVNSTKAMAQWQHDHSFTPNDGIPTYEQMVALGATVPEVLPRPRRSLPGSVTGLLLNAVPFFFGLLPKVNLHMNPVLLALGRINKATIATLVTAAATLLLLFGIDIKPDTQGIIITVASAVVTGLVTWLVPNAPPTPLAAQGLLNRSLAVASDKEVSDWEALAASPMEVPPGTGDLTGDDFAPLAAGVTHEATANGPRPVSGE